MIYVYKRSFRCYFYLLIYYWFLWNMYWFELVRRWLMVGWCIVVVNIYLKLFYKNNYLIFKDVYKMELIYLLEIDILLLEMIDIVLFIMLVKWLVDENVFVIFCDDKWLLIVMLMFFYGCYDLSL